MIRYIVIFSVATLCFGFPYPEFPNDFIDEDTDLNAFIDAEPIYRARRDLFGGRNNFPGGGFSQQFGMKHGPAFGSISQSFDRHGFGSPQVLTGGMSFTNDNGHGLTFGGSKAPSMGSQLFAEGRAPIVNTPDHKVDAWARHENNFDKNGQRMFETNSAGVDYKNQNGFGLSVSRSQVPGGKPDDQIMATYEKSF